MNATYTTYCEFMIRKSIVTIARDKYMHDVIAQQYHKMLRENKIPFDRTHKFTCIFIKEYTLGDMLNYRFKCVLELESNDL